MSAIPKRLTTKHLFNPDTGKAAGEAHANMLWLILAGQLDAAWQIALALLSRGPWRVSPKNSLLYQAWRHFLWLGERLQRERPALDESNEMAQMALREFEASRQPKTEAPSLPGLLIGLSNEPARTAWSQAELDAILATVAPDNFGGAFNSFQHDAALVLKERVESRNPAPGDHAAIADTVEQGARIAFPKEIAVFAMKAAWPAAALDLIAGHRDAAAARLARLLPGANISGPESHHLELEWILHPIFAELLDTRALALALGISGTGSAAYLEAFASRSPYTLKTATPRAWKIVLREYNVRVKEDGIDADALINLEHGIPTCRPLLKRAIRGQLLNTACGENELGALEARLGAKLPPSYRDFLLTSNGLAVPNFVSLLPAAQVDWFAKFDEYGAIDAWNHADDEATDEQYNTYGADQDCIHMRPRHLRAALQISTSIDGDVLLLIPEVRFGDEWEAWFLGNKNPGAYRYRSFRDLMEQRVLADGD